jgi:hypothetical protein
MNQKKEFLVPVAWTLVRPKSRAAQVDIEQWLDQLGDGEEMFTGWLAEPKGISILGACFIEGHCGIAVDLSRSDPKKKSLKADPVGILLRG